MKIRCPGCQSTLVEPTERLGQSFKCPACDRVIRALAEAQGPVGKKNPAPLLRASLLLAVLVVLFGVVYWIGYQNAAPSPPSHQRAETSPQLSTVSGRVLNADGSSARQRGKSVLLNATRWKSPLPEIQPDIDLDFSSSKDRQGNESMATRKEQQESDSPTDASISELPFSLEYQFGGPGSIVGYDFELTVTPQSDSPMEIPGVVFMRQIDGGQSTRRIRMLTGQLGGGLPAEEYSTGIGIPGKQIVVPYPSVTEASDIQVVVDGETWPARLVKEYASDGFAVIEYDGPEFEKPRVTTSFGNVGLLNVMRVNSRGQIEIVLDHRVWPTTGFGVMLNSRGGATNRLRLDDRWNSAIVFDATGVITGFCCRARDSLSVLSYGPGVSTSCVMDIRRVTKHLPDKLDTTHRKTEQPFQSMNRIRNDLTRNVALVKVRRQPKEDGWVQIKISQQVEERKYTQADPLTWHMKGGNFLKQYRSDGSASSTHGMFRLPFFAGYLGQFPMIEIVPGKRSWTNEYKIQFTTTGGMQVARPRRGQPADAEGAVTEKIEVVSFDPDTNVATLQRDITILPLESRRSWPEFKPVTYRAKQQIQFDASRGIFTGGQLIGDLAYGPEKQRSRARIDFVFQIMSPEDAVEEYSRRLPPEIPVNRIPHRPLADFDAADIARKITDESLGGYDEAFRTLAQIIPESNQSISAALANDFHVWAVDPVLFKIGSRWIAAEHLPDLLKRVHLNTNTSLLKPCLELLRRSPPVPLDGEDYLVALLGRQLGESVCANLICERYPNLGETLYLKALAHIDHAKRSYIDGKVIYMALEVLELVGTKQSVEPLEQLKRKFGVHDRLRSDSRNRNVREGIEDALRKINDRISAGQPATNENE